MKICCAENGDEMIPVVEHVTTEITMRFKDVFQ